MPTFMDRVRGFLDSIELNTAPPGMTMADKRALQDEGLLKPDPTLEDAKRLPGQIVGGAFETLTNVRPEEGLAIRSVPVTVVRGGPTADFRPSVAIPHEIPFAPFPEGGKPFKPQAGVLPIIPRIPKTEVGGVSVIENAPTALALGMAVIGGPEDLARVVGREGVEIAGKLGKVAPASPVTGGVVPVDVQRSLEGPKISRAGEQRRGLGPPENISETGANFEFLQTSGAGIDDRKLGGLSPGNLAKKGGKSAENASNQLDTFFGIQDDIDDAVSELPGKGLGAGEWERQMSARLAGKQGVGVMPRPLTMVRWLENPDEFTGWLRGAIEKRPELLAQAKDGLAGAREMHKLARAGKLTPATVQSVYVWGALSKMLGPFDQEAIWIRMYQDPRLVKQFQASLDGKFKMPVGKADEAREDTWKGLVKTVMDDQLADAGDVLAGRGGISNANNSVYGILEAWNGRWDELTEILNDGSLTGPQMRDKMWRTGFLGAGIGDKVNSFSIAMLARPDVLVMDRWQIANFWMDNLVAAKSQALGRTATVDDVLKFSPETGIPEVQLPFYDSVSGGLLPGTIEEVFELDYYAFGPKGPKVPDDLVEQKVLSRPTKPSKKAPEGGGLKPIVGGRTGSGALFPSGTQNSLVSHATYRALEGGMRELIERAGPELTEIFGYTPDVFDLHWLTWNVVKNEPVGHSSLSFLTELGARGGGKSARGIAQGARSAQVHGFSQRAVGGGQFESDVRSFGFEKGVPTERPVGVARGNEVVPAKRAISELEAQAAELQEVIDSPPNKTVQRAARAQLRQIRERIQGLGG